MEFASESREIEKKSAAELPADMLFEILSRASFETVERSKAVSKGVRQIIFEPTFLPSHCRRTNSLYGCYFQTMTRNRYQSEFVSDFHHSGAAASINHDDMQILASSNHGILCCEKHEYKKNRYYICKPATNQWQPLPNPKLRYVTEAVAIVVVKSRPLLYNIVRVSRHKLNNKYICEIFHSETWAWEKTQAPNLPYHDFIMPRQTAVSVGKSVYWLTHEDNVLAFDLKEKSFQCFPLPEHCNDGYSQKQLLKYEDGLGFSCVKDDCKMMEVWEAQGRRWTRKMTVDVKLLEQVFVYPRLLELCSSDVAFMKTANGAGFINFRDGSFSEICVPYHINRGVHNIFMFRSDLETVHLKGKREANQLTKPKGSTKKTPCIQFFLFFFLFLVCFLTFY